MDYYDDVDVSKLSFDNKLSMMAAEKLRREQDMMESFNDYTAQQVLKDAGHFPNSPEYDELYFKVRQGIDADLPYEQIQRIVLPATKVMEQELPITSKLVGMATGVSLPFKRNGGGRDGQARYRL